MTDSIKRMTNLLLSNRPFMFRNDCGVGYVGGKEYRDNLKRLCVVGCSHVHYGLFAGSGDYIGWTTVDITPEMIGKQIAVFTSVEMKSSGDRLHDNQRKWFEVVKQSGGIAEIYEEKRNGDIIIRSEL